MGRRNIMNQSSADVNVPGYADLVDKIQKFKQAEKNFYEGREDALKKYPGLSRKTANQIEKEYDKLYGDDPWNYSSRAGSSSNERTQTDASTDSEGNDADRFFVKIPSSGSGSNAQPVDGIGNTEAYLGSFYLEYNPGVGAVDIDVTYENISFFKNSGVKGNFGSSRSGDDQPYHEGFGEVPIFYNANNNYSGKQLHMFKKLGDIYDASVGAAYSAYQSAKTNYDNNNGSSGTTTPIIRTTFDFAWDGRQGDVNAGYNRPVKLKNKLRKEAMGFN